MKIQVLYSLKKNSTYKWTHAAQASVVQGSTVVIVAIIVMMAKSDNRNLN